MRPLAIAHGDPLVEGDQPRTLAEALAHSVEIFPEGRFIFLGPEGKFSYNSYIATWERSRRVLHGLQLRGVRPGDKLILYFRSCQHFIPALWASLLGGIIPVPLVWNEWSRHDERRAPEVFAHLKRVLSAPRIVTDALEEHQEALGLDPKNTLAINAVEEDSPTDSFFESDGERPRLLVLSSGTTAFPNLVALSGRAVLNRWWPSMP